MSHLGHVFSDSQVDLRPLRIKLIWVPEHRNIEGDGLVRQGTTDILRDKDTWHDHGYLQAPPQA